MITQSELKKFFTYDRTTGELRSKVARKAIRGVGKRAGGLTKNGYVLVSFRSHGYYAHRLVWLWFRGEFPNGSIDHINGIKTDNRIGNLRLASPSQNTAWRKLNKNNTSGFRGVYYFRPVNKWIASIRHNWKQTHLGYFDTKEEAARVYDAAAVKCFGKFAKTNEAMGLF